MLGFLEIRALALDCEQIADCVWDEDLTSHSLPDSAGLILKNLDIIY